MMDEEHEVYGGEIPEEVEGEEVEGDEVAKGGNDDESNKVCTDHFGSHGFHLWKKNQAHSSRLSNAYTFLPTLLLARQSVTFR